MIGPVVAMIALAVLLVVLAFRRLHTPAERVVAVDALSACGLAACLAAAAHTGQTAFLDVAIGFALLAFLATVGWAHAIAGRVGRDGRR
jgi:multisubunit Na+/H+ antiporter MnhF subunit